MKKVSTYLIYMIQYSFFQDQGSHSNTNKRSHRYDRTSRKKMMTVSRGTSQNSPTATIVDLSDKTSQHSSQGILEMHRSQEYAGSDEVLNTQRSNDSSQKRRMKEKWELYRESSNKMSPVSMSQEDYERGSCYTATPKSSKSIRNEMKIATTSPLKTQLCTPARSPQQSAGTPGTPESSWSPFSPYTDYTVEHSPIIGNILEKVNDVTDNDDRKRYSSRRLVFNKKVISVSLKLL